MRVFHSMRIREKPPSGRCHIKSNSFDALSNHDKVCHLLSGSSIINYSAKAFHEILNTAAENSQICLKCKYVLIYLVYN